MSSYSKGPRGLSVLLRVVGICTDIPISPSPWSRQRPDRYTIRAGRNLPDKEFRSGSFSSWLTDKNVCPTSSDATDRNACFTGYPI